MPRILAAGGGAGDQNSCSISLGNLMRSPRKACAGRIPESCKEQGEQASRLFGDCLSLPNQRPHGRDAHACPRGPIASVATFGHHLRRKTGEIFSRGRTVFVWKNPLESPQI